MRNRDLALVCRALADPTRRRLLDLLHVGPKRTGDLCAAFPGLTRFAVLKHLGLLRRAHLVLVRADGRERVNFLNAVPLRAIGERWLRPEETAQASGLLALGRLAERGEPGGPSMPVPAVSLSGLRPGGPGAVRRAPAGGTRAPRRVPSTTRPVEKPS